MPAEQLAELFTLIEGGAEVAAENIVSFPSDIMPAGATAATGVTETVTLGNGAAVEVSQLATVEAGAATGTTTGSALLALDVGVAGAAIAPCLGLAVGAMAGNALYDLSPEFWADVSDSLIEAGETVGGKVRGFLNAATGKVCLSERTIEIFKNKFLDAGLFAGDYIVTPTGTFTLEQFMTQYNQALSSGSLYGYRIQSIDGTMYAAYKMTAGQTFNLGLCAKELYKTNSKAPMLKEVIIEAINDVWMVIVQCPTLNNYPAKDGYPSRNFRALHCLFCPANPSAPISGTKLYKFYSYFEDGTSQVSADQGYDLREWMLYETEGIISSFVSSASGMTLPSYGESMFYTIRTLLNNTFNSEYAQEHVQPGATVPDTNPFPQTYVNWNPVTINNINTYPVELPEINPNPTQQEAQNPDPNPDPSKYLQWLLNNLNQPEPDPNIQPAPQPEPDPDPQPDPDPIPSGGTDPIPPDPPDPNPDPPDPPIPVGPVLPATVDSNAMFTVYSPSLSQLNSFGGWLWNSSIIEQILRMWQNPLDGIIALMKVYAVPSTGASRNIQVGYLDSGVSAPVVTSQFATVDCGTVEVNERKHNATDYTPYVSLHLYLPFIGIVELDPDEFMDGTINVKYSIDLYTGTCLAEVRCTRSIDMPNATILYTFSGNASQQLPLTSANFAGALSSLVSAVGGGIMIASGGAVGGIAGAAALGHSLTHEMVHVGHSGALSSNAGIMASRKPYLIISRRHAYDANNYATEYGYPANKAVYLGNCSGFTRVKAGHLKCKADAVEKEEIMALLEKGVIL